MRLLLLAVCLGVPSFSLSLLAAEKKPAPTEQTPLAKPEDYVDELETLLTEDDSDGQDSKKDIEARWKKRIARVDVLIAEFRKKYPADHPLRWDILFWEANSNDVREEVKLPRRADARPSVDVYAEIAAAPDARPETRAKASAERIAVLSAQVLEKTLPLADWEKLVAEHFAKFPDYLFNTMLYEQEASFIRKMDEPRLIPFLEQLAKNPKAEVAAMAKDKLTAAKERQALQSKPFDLKFQAFDGGDVDIEKLRGKVVLVQFWATWCSICMKEMPHIQETYAKLHDRGFEIVGISLDDEEKELRGILKKRKIAWPQYFDSKGWDTPMVKRFGIEQLPALWLVNKQGMVVDIDAGKDLEEKVAKLLAE